MVDTADTTAEPSESSAPTASSGPPTAATASAAVPQAASAIQPVAVPQASEAAPAAASAASPAAASTAAAAAGDAEKVATTGAGAPTAGAAAETKKLVRKRAAEAAAEAAAAKKARVNAAPPATLVVFGLGNAGVEHRRQRHNTGERVLRLLAGRLGATEGDAVEGAAGLMRFSPKPGSTWYLLPPQGPINDSGPALKAALAALGEPAAAFLVVVDDCSLSLGTMRLKRNSSAGGHNGLRGIEAIYGQDYHRLKIGIGGHPTNSHVGGEVSGPEAELAERVENKAAEACESWLRKGPQALEAVMCKVNGPEFKFAQLPPGIPATVSTSSTNGADAGANTSVADKATAPDAPAAPASAEDAAVKAKGEQIRGLKEKLKAVGITGKRLSEHTEVVKLVAELHDLKAKL